MKKLIVMCLVIIVTAVLVGCGGSGSSSSPNNNNTSSLAKFVGSWSGPWVPATGGPSGTGTVTMQIASNGSLTGTTLNTSSNFSTTFTGSISSSGVFTAQNNEGASGTTTLTGTLSLNAQNQIVGVIQDSSSGSVGGGISITLSNSAPSVGTYFPLTAGKTWTYSYTLDGTTSTVTFSAKGVTSINGMSGYQIQQSSTDSIWYTLAAEGISEVGEEHDQESSPIQPMSPAKILIPATTTAGNTWNQTYQESFIGSSGTSIENLTSAGSVVGMESITVPAGVFNALHIHIGTTGDNTSTYDYWYAAGVGMVKTIGSGGQQRQILLVSHN